MEPAPYRPIISVIIPIFNVEQHLAETVESVLNQEYENWELILVDDGSTDESASIAKKYAEQLPDKIKYLTHPGHANKGVCATRNLAIRYAQGEYIALLDSDDIWTKEKLKNQVGLIEKYPQCSMFCEASLYWHSWNGSGKEDKIVYVGVPSEQVYYPPHLALNIYPLTKGSAPCPSGILIKKSTLLKIGGFEETFIGKYSFYEDQAFLIKVYLHEPTFVSGACNNYYRIRAGSAMETAKNREHYKQVRHFFLKWAKDYLIKNKINDPEINKLMAKALLPYKRSFIQNVFRMLNVRKS